MSKSHFKFMKISFRNDAEISIQLGLAAGFFHDESKKSKQSKHKVLRDHQAGSPAPSPRSDRRPPALCITLPCLGYICHFRISVPKDMMKITKEQPMFLRPTKTFLHTNLSKQRLEAATGTQSSPHQSPWKTIWLRQRSAHEAPV